jgi:hypothetical protein
MPARDVRRLLHLSRSPCDDRDACIRARLAMITCVLKTRSPFGVRALPPFVKNLGRASPFFHVRSPHGARTLPTFLLDRGSAHVTVIASRRSCSRSRERIHLSAFHSSRGSRLCFTPLAFTLSRSCFGAHARSRLSTLTSCSPLGAHAPAFSQASCPPSRCPQARSPFDVRVYAHFRFPPSFVHPR